MVPKWYNWIYLMPLVAAMLMFYALRRRRSYIEEDGSSVGRFLRSFGWHGARLHNFLTGVFNDGSN